MNSSLSESQSELRPLLSPEEVEATQVYPVIHMIRADVIHFIDTPLTYEALTAPDLTYTLIRPLVDKYVAIQQDGNFSVVFCFLLNRVHFVRDRNLATATLSKSRATLCEILAIRIMRENANDMLRLTMTATTSWPVYSGAEQDLIERAKAERSDDLEERVGNAIEMAIISKAKRFIKSSSCQKVIDGIWSGKCVYQAQSSHSILSDTYKRTPIHFYDPHKAPLLDHYRLKVPAIRSVLEYMNFLGLFILFVIAIEFNERDTINVSEFIFMVYALGFTLEKVAAMQEHGIKVYFKGTWNGFDLAFVTTFWIYGFLRLYGMYHDVLWARTLGIDCLAIIACLMFPRLAFVTLRDNLMVLSLRAMMVQFVVLMCIAAFCFCGFLYALWTLSRNQAQYSVGHISWWMLDLFFGLDASGFDRATTFHPIFGPVLMVTYACLSNTLLLTVLVSILSHTFSTINEDAAAEAMFRKAVSTIEGVKADSLFSYQPPINLFALFVMLPMSYILSPRWFHKVNVFMIRLTSFPILLGIAVYERQAKKNHTIGFYSTFSAIAEKAIDTLPRQFKRLTFFDGLAGADADIDAIFEIEEEASESALDTTEYPMSPVDAPRDRRMSPTKRATKLPSPPPANRQHTGPARDAPRTRVASLLSDAAHNAAHAVSPLAQLFQPLIVDDSIPEESEASTEDGQVHQPHVVIPIPQISYGPASRRRLSSIARRPTGHDFNAQAHATGMRKFPGTSGSAGTDHEHPMPESPSQLEESASQMKKDEGDDMGNTSSQVFSRLEKIEERQQRIERLLEQVVAGISQPRTLSKE
ncbi:Transient receptor potential calcium channel [Pleurotus pulmonarius]